MDLDFLFERIREDPGIAIRFCETKIMLADMLTKGSFTESQWRVLCDIAQIEIHRNIHGPVAVESLKSGSSPSHSALSILPVMAWKTMFPGSSQQPPKMSWTNCPQLPPTLATASPVKKPPPVLKAPAFQQRPQC